MPAWLTYSLVRLGVFAVAFGVLWAIGLQWLWAALAATLIALCVSFIFFRRQREAMSAELAERRQNPDAHRTADDDAEDSAVDAAAGGVAEGHAAAAEHPRD